MIRSLETLQQDQAALMAAYREECAPRPAIATLPAAGASTPATAYGRVLAVIASDPDYGPHLLVARQTCAGTPPTLTDAATAPLRCYPTPNHTITDYATNEIIRIAPAHGAIFAERLA